MSMSLHQEAAHQSPLRQSSVVMSSWPCTVLETLLVQCRAGPAAGNSRAVRLVAPAGKAKDMGDGVLPGIASWPPKPITEHGQPKPEDDPANFAGDNIVNLCARR